MRDFKTQHIQQQTTVTPEVGRWCELHGCPGACLGPLGAAQRLLRGQAMEAGLTGWGARGHGSLTCGSPPEQSRVFFGTVSAEPRSRDPEGTREHFAHTWRLFPATGRGPRSVRAQEAGAFQRAAPPTLPTKSWTRPGSIKQAAGNLTTFRTKAHRLPGSHRPAAPAGSVYLDVQSVIGKQRSGRQTR